MSESEAKVLAAVGCVLCVREWGALQNGRLLLR